MTSVNIAKTRSFPGADIGRDHGLLMMTFKLHLRKIQMQGPTRIKFDLKKRENPQAAHACQAMIGGKFAPLTLVDPDDTEVDTLKTIFNIAMTKTTSEI